MRAEKGENQGIQEVIEGVMEIMSIFIIGWKRKLYKDKGKA